MMLLVQLEAKTYSFRNSIHCIRQFVRKNESVIFKCIFLKTHFEENGDFSNAITLKRLMIFEVSQVFGEDKGLV